MIKKLLLLLLICYSFATHRVEASTLVDLENYPVNNQLIEAEDIYSDTARIQSNFTILNNEKADKLTTNSFSLTNTFLLPPEFVQGFTVGSTSIINNLRELTNIAELTVDQININGSTIQATVGDLSLDTTGDINVLSNRIVNLASPINTNDAASKYYIDSQINYVLNGTPFPLINVDGGTIDGAIIGAVVPEAATFTTLSSSTLTSGTTTITAATITDSTGAISFSNEDLSTTGNLSVNKAISNIVIYDTETLATTGVGDAVNITSNTSYVETTGAHAVTLADGVEGQRKTVIMDVDAGDMTLTPDNFFNGTSITFDDIGEAVVLEFHGTEWFIVSTYGTVTVNP